MQISRGFASWQRYCTTSSIAALNRGRHLYSAGRPSRWALAHVSSFVLFCLDSRLSRDETVSRHFESLVIRTAMDYDKEGTRKKRIKGVPQTHQQISAASGPKFTVLSEHVDDVLLFKKFFSDCRYVP